MKTITNIDRFNILVLLLFIGDLVYGFQGRYTANCDGNLKSAKQLSVLVKVENDSVIIHNGFYNQCCPNFELTVSELKNDTVYVSFKDTSQWLVCTCECYFNAKINIGPVTSKSIQVNFNGKNYNILPQNHRPLIEVSKKWTEINAVVHPDYPAPRVIEYSILSDKTGAFCWNGKFYYKVETMAWGNRIETADTMARYIREENGKVFMVDTTYTGGCEEVLIYDFTLNEGDTVTLGYNSIQYVVVPIVKPAMNPDGDYLALADLTEPQMSEYTIWKFGVGDLRGLFKSTESLYLSGAINQLTCCSVDGSFLYHVEDYPECGMTTFVETFDEKSCEIFPNPAKDYLEISNLKGEEPYDYFIVNSLGQVVRQGEVRQRIDFVLRNGIYFLIVRSNQETVSSKKIIVER